MDERITLTITSDLFDEADQEASIRKSISIRTLIGEIQKEFSLGEGTYVLRVRGAGRALELDKTVEQLGLQTGAALEFTRERRAARLSGTRALTGAQQIYLVEKESGQTFEIPFVPAVIGRPDANNPSSAALLAVNLGDLPEARTVSRQHARITERGGAYFVESMNERNLAQLNDAPMALGERRSIGHGDRLQIGRIVLIFRVRGASAIVDAPAT